MARTHHRILHAGASHLSASQLLACSIQRAPNLTRIYSRMHAPTTHCNSCARMLLSPAQLFARARVRRRRTAAPALACSSARPSRARHGCSISGQKRILHARMHAPPTHCSSCARMLLILLFIPLFRGPLLKKKRLCLLREWCVLRCLGAVY